MLQITRLCLPRTHLLVGMAYDGILTVVGWQSLISGTLHLPVVTLTKKNGTTMDRQTEAKVTEAQLGQLLIILHNY